MDAGGAIPPSRTPPPARPDPYCRRATPTTTPRGGPALRCGFGHATPLCVEETGWPTASGRSEAEQRRALRAIVTTAVRYRRTYHLTDLRRFGLRDNDSASPDPQARFGLLRDDDRPKPAFAAFRSLVAGYGARRIGLP